MITKEKLSSRPMAFIYTVIVEYDCIRKRAQKTFTDPYKAKAFYVQKYKAGKNPKVRDEHEAS
jgi:hypothetical protein